MITPGDGDQLRRLLRVGRELFSERDTEAVLNRILHEAREITGARYAALGVMDSEQAELERFLTIGVDPETHRAIGVLPRGRGVLGVLISDPKPLRLNDVGRHPQSYGFPPNHPRMASFLGIPIVVRGQAWGNLYLTEKQDGESFTDDDEEAAVLLAQWAAIAIDNMRLYETSEQRRRTAEQSARGLEAARDIGDAIGTVDLDRVLELIVKRGRALIDARTVLIMLREGDELVVAASAGHAVDARGRRVPVAGSTSGEVLESRRAQRITDVDGLRIGPTELGVPEAHSALFVPLLNRGSALGVLAAFDQDSAGEPFSPIQEQLLRTFAASAANAVAINRSVETDRLRSTVAAADAERGRWARELHDQTLQALGALRVLLAANAGRGDAFSKDDAIRQAIADIELEIENLRRIISDLRPSLLDDIGLEPAIEALLARGRDTGLEITSALTLPARGTDSALSAELETTIYRLVQEALTNVIKHAGAESVEVEVAADDDIVRLAVTDDGVGFDPGDRSSGFGLAGMRERVYLAGGTLVIEPSEAGTTVRAELPLLSSAKTRTSSHANQLAS
jgi:signal transduction histidine kinase